MNSEGLLSSLHDIAKGNDLRYVMPGYYTCITEYNEAETFTLYGTQKETKGRAEGEAIGEARGRAEEKINTLSELVKNSLLSLEDAAKTAGMSVSEFSEKAGL